MKELFIVALLCHIGQWAVRNVIKIILFIVLFGFVLWLIFEKFDGYCYIQEYWSYFIEFLDFIKVKVFGYVNP